MLPGVSYERLLKALMWAAIALGAYSRLRGLGVWPLGVDEYFVLRSVDSIVQHGVPVFSCGGYYMRGITLQYLIAPLYALGSSPEFAGRIVTVACSFVVLAGVYQLGKRLSGLTVACAGVALLSLSLWEIEFARYARMYIPFQAVFVWYLLALHYAVVEGRARAQLWAWGLSILGVLTWEGGLFLLLTNFVPSLMARRSVRLRDLVISAMLLTIGYAYSRVDFRFMDQPAPFPADLPIQMGGSHLVMPSLLATTLPAHPVWAVAGVAILALSLWAVARLIRMPAPGRERLVWGVLIALSLGNLFGCVVIALLIAALAQWLDWRRASRKAVAVALVPLMVNFVFWMAYAATHTDWYAFYPGFGPGGNLSKLFVVLFKYPNVFDGLLFEWLHVIPRQTLLLGGLTALACLWALASTNSQRTATLRVVIVTCLIAIVVVGVVDTMYVRTRYTFFLLPVLYLAALVAIQEVFARHLRARPARGLVWGCATLAIVGGTEDFGWNHLWHIDRASQNYRLNDSPAVAEHFYTRADYLTTAEYVNLRVRPGDAVVVTVLPVAHYLHRVDYVYRNYRVLEFASVACDRGQRERWTGAPLIYRDSALLKLIRHTRGRVWLLAVGQHKLVQWLRRNDVSIGEVYRGLGNRVTVYEAKSAPGTSAVGSGR